VTVKAQKNYVKKTLDHEKARFKEQISKMEEEHKQELAKLNNHISDIEKELDAALAQTKSKKIIPVFDSQDLGVTPLEEDELSQSSTTSSTFSRASSSQSSSTGGDLLSIAAKKHRVLKPNNSNKVKVPLQKNNIFGVSRPGASGTSGLLKRMYENASKPPDGMTYDGMGRTVRAEIAFKPAPVVKKFKH
jgi:hypothetical protein